MAKNKQRSDENRQPIDAAEVEAAEYTEEPDCIDDEEPDCIDDLELFECPFCGKQMQDWFTGGCPHFAFSYELVNFEYMGLNASFETHALERLRLKGYNVDKLPCPLEPWAGYNDYTGLPSLDAIVPGLKLVQYMYEAPHGHGSWGVVAGFIERLG